LILGWGQGNFSVSPEFLYESKIAFVVLGGTAQVVQHLSSKYEALNSNLVLPKNKISKLKRIHCCCCCCCLYFQDKVLNI
jgi:hypothetical protein